VTRTRNTPLLIVRGLTIVAVAIVAVVVILLLTGKRSYELNLRMADADGLRTGSQVLLGGIPVGTVTRETVSGNTVIVHLGVNPHQVKIGRGVRASVVAANLLGEEYVQLSPGKASEPLPSGTTLKESATTAPTALDQLIDVMDGSTRARLADLLVEAGLAVSGRKTQVSDVLRQLPLSVNAATRLLTTMVHDNHTLSDLVANSDQFITRINQQSGDLKTLIGTASRAGSVLASNADNLQTLVVNATHTMRTFTTVFASGRTTLVRLVPSLDYVTQAAPEIDDVLTEVKPFTQAAVPVLDQAASVSPVLSKLADQATPTIKRAIPDLVDLNTDARLSKPLAGWLGLSAPRFFDILGGWPDAVQYRNASSHVFGGDFYLDPIVVLNAADHGASAVQQCKNLLGIKSTAILRTIGKLAAAEQARATGCAGGAQAVGTTHTNDQPLAGVSTTVNRVTTTVSHTLTTAANGVKTTVSGVVSKLAGGVSSVIKNVGQSAGNTISKVTAGVASHLPAIGHRTRSAGPQTTTTSTTLVTLLNYLTGK
jgi:virulence factor Mce-like protein